MSCVVKYILLILLLVSAACASVSQKKNPALRKFTPESKLRSSRTPLTEKERDRLLSSAKQALGKSTIKLGNKTFRNDCSGAIRAIFTNARIGLGGIIKSPDENDVKAIYRYIQKYGSVLKEKPKAGDLVFFHNTYDRSRNGLMNDALTHIGIVEKIVGDTVHFIHHLGKSVIRSRMNLSMPKESFHPKTKERINHMLRRASGPNRAYTAAELFAGFGRL